MKQFAFILFYLYVSIGTLLSNTMVLNPQPQLLKESDQTIEKPTVFNVIGLEDLSSNTLRALLCCIDDRTGRDGFPLRVGIRGDESVRKYKKMIPERREGYYLAVSDREIVVAGNDRRGLYYGLRTLEQLLEQAGENGSLPEVEIADWPDVAVRGVVEGFYGQPWSHEARMSLIDFYSDHKLNTYIYGPKNDRYHRARWRQLYPEAEARQLQSLVARAREKEVDFVWAVHPGDDIKWNEEDRDKLVAKLESMYQLGVRAFAVFFDDIGKGKNAAEQADLLNYINRNFIQAKGDVRPLIMCPSDYNRSRWHPETAYLETLGDKLDANIHIMWTGDRALSDITADNLTWVQTIFKRRPYIWWNFPVTDFSNDRILMGEVFGIDPSIRTEVSAFISNPMEYAEASKLALFSVANYTWNINAYDAKASWLEGIRSLLPDAAEAFACFCRHSSATGTDHFPRPESECIRRAADRFVKQYTQSGNWQAEDMQTLKDEFDRMALAANELRLAESNLALTREIDPWITAFGLWAQMGQEVLALTEAATENAPKAFDYALKRIGLLKQLLEKNNQETRPASIGTAVIQPFVRTVSKNAVKRFNQQNQTTYSLNL